MAFCSACGKEIPAGTTMCPACSGAVAPGGAITPSGTSGLTDNLAGMLAYFFIPAIVFLLIEPYNRRRFVRFHSFQSIFLFVAVFILNLVLFNLLLGALLFTGFWAIYGLVRLAELVLWVFLLVKAYQ